MRKTSDKIRERLEANNVRYWANDNIADYIEEGEKQELIDEATEAFENVLQHLLIDTKTDPNSMDTGRRMAKMYINEIMSGRYDPMPNPSSFPNYIEGGYEGMLVVRSELTSLCSHHHQTVRGVAYIGIIAGPKLLGLSKYTRIAQWCAMRGTLQEDLNVMIANAIQKETGTEHVGVYVQATHGCCENRGIRAHSSLTQTTVLRGSFKEDAVKKEFIDNVKLQQEYSTTQR
jgi:GTP cyclohydrolase I